MPTARLLFLGDFRRIDAVALTSPLPGDPWHVEPVADAGAALRRLAGSTADALVIDATAGPPPGADRLLAEADSRGVSVVLLGSPVPDGVLARTRVVSVTPDGGWRHDLARVIEEVRIDQKIKEFRELGGDEFVVEMIDLLVQQTPEQIESMRTALFASNLRDVQRAAHSMKSSVGNFGARIVQELSLQIEHAAANGDAASLAERIGQLQKAYERVWQYLVQKKG
jgi:HPt (histidine-containing phosphotransfer) domain-containing protein